MVAVPIHLNVDVSYGAPLVGLVISSLYVNYNLAFRGLTLSPPEDYQELRQSKYFCTTVAIPGIISYSSLSLHSSGLYHPAILNLSNPFNVGCQAN